MFTTAEDFNLLPYNIPNNGEAGVASTLALFIDQEEELILIKVLGRGLYNALKENWTAISALGDWAVGTVYALNAKVVYANAVWTSLQGANVGNIPADGSLFWVKDVQLTKWLLLAEGDEYELHGKKYVWDGMNKLLKGYVYARWTKDNTSPVTSAGGTFTASSENGEVNTPSRQIVAGYNDFVDRLGDECMEEGDKNTLHGYLVAKESDFTQVGIDWGYTSFTAYLSDNFKAVESINVFNL